ncbi:hypothetical protein ACQKFN_12745 [Serratia sp. NPDC071084]|uniref:hypothetical protein n=1 Tax=Serratia sp. NPDC071084 TaxID=3390676 RepID=UPI003D043051
MPGHYERCDCWHRAHIATELHRRGVARRARQQPRRLNIGRACPATTIDVIPCGMSMSGYDERNAHIVPGLHRRGVARRARSSIGGEIQAGHARPLRTL